MSATSMQSLEQSASEQRVRIHKTAAELQSKIVATREKFTIANMARQHFVGAALTVSALTFSWGFRFAGTFLKR